MTHDLAHKTILLVEDNPDDIDLALRAFRKHNLANQIIVKQDGQEALDYMLASTNTGNMENRCPIQVVLLDLNLPKIDGLEVLRSLRQAKHTRYLPVVILTSSDEEQDIEESYRLGCNSYIRKPVEFDSFVSAAQHIGLYWLLLNETVNS